VDQRGVRSACLSLVGMAVAAGLLLFFFPVPARTALTRLANPFGATEWPHQPQIEVLTDRIRIGKDEPFEEIADHVREFWNIGFGPVTDLVPILEYNGIIVIEEPVACEDMDAVSRWQGGRPYILFAGEEEKARLAPGRTGVSRMQERNAGLLGHLQAMELQNTALVYSAEELMLLRQQLMAQTNLQAAYYARELASRAQEDTTLRALVDVLATPVPTGTRVSLRVGP